MNTVKKENRKHPRINIHSYALIGYRGVFVPGVAVNMSPTGLMVRLKQPPKVLPVELNVFL
ncbi:MAG: PilZ domain-containing protein, partial [Gammaproteobacteria bacterium]